MSRFLPNAVRSLTSLFGSVLDFTIDGLRFLRLTALSRSVLSAEVLFLRKQLAFYEERRVQPGPVERLRSRLPRALVSAV